MASFDVIETSGKAYIKAWEERKYLLRLATYPLIIKIVFFILIMYLGMENNPIQQTLVMLPAYFAEGWMLAHVTRLIWLDQRWPMQLSGNPESDHLMISSRSRGILAGMVTYVLLKMAQNAMLSPVLQSEENFEKLASSQAPEPDITMYVLSLLALFVLIWAFRFLFIYIPAAANESIEHFLKRFKSYVSSFYFLGAWLICYVPFVLMTTLLMGVIKIVFAGNIDMGLYVVFIGHLCMDTAASIVITICFSYAIRQIMQGPHKEPMA